MKAIGSKLNFIFLFIVVLILQLGNDSYFLEESQEIKIDSGDTSWMIVSCAFVLLMTPGLAFFYGLFSIMFAILLGVGAAFIRRFFSNLRKKLLLKS